MMDEYFGDLAVPQGASCEIPYICRRDVKLSSHGRFQRGLERILECRLLCNWSMNAAISSELLVLIASQRYEDVYTKVCN
jgi:hypothetical protein